MKKLAPVVANTLRVLIAKDWAEEILIQHNKDRFDEMCRVYPDYYDGKYKLEEAQRMVWSLIEDSFTDYIEEDVPDGELRKIFKEAQKLSHKLRQAE